MRFLLDLTDDSGITRDSNASFLHSFKKKRNKDKDIQSGDVSKIAEKIETRHLPFYMSINSGNNSIQPQPDTIPRKSKLFPEESQHDDRIIGRLKHNLIYHLMYLLDRPINVPATEQQSYIRRSWKSATEDHFVVEWFKRMGKGARGQVI